MGEGGGGEKNDLEADRETITRNERWYNQDA